MIQSSLLPTRSATLLLTLGRILRSKVVFYTLKLCVKLQLADGKIDVAVTKRSSRPRGSPPQSEIFVDLHIISHLLINNSLRIKD